MQQKIREIATRIQELRELSGIEASQMARKLDISTEAYQNIESGIEDIPVGLLFRIASELKADPTLLLSGESPRLQVFTVTRQGKGISVERRKQYTYQSLAANFINKKIEPLLVTVEPNTRENGPIKASHPGQEFNYVLEGRLRIHLHDHDIVLEPGDSIFYDSNHEHAMEALDGRPARFLAIIFQMDH
ncbi:MAG: XRE family transcriptional regulator [Syntrophotaleaceae bacterium]